MTAIILVSNSQDTFPTLRFQVLLLHLFELNYKLYIQGLDKIMKTMETMGKNKNKIMWCWTAFGIQHGLNSPGN